MNEKLNIQNLIELLAEKHGMDKADAESFVMVVRKANGEEWELEIESGGEDLGLTFEKVFSVD